jgi:nickel-dependent lactate racemase
MNKVYELPYGKQYLTLKIPPKFAVDLILAEDISPREQPEKIIQAALENPIGSTRLEDFTHANDKTRPVPHEFILPPLLEQLERIGFRPEQIKLLVATGTHIPIHSHEFPLIVPQKIIDRYEIFSHDCDDNETLVDYGFTSKGTPIMINRHFAEAELRIVVGNIEPHHFMGFSGGVKSAAIGLAGRQTINKNHLMLVEPESRIAEYEHNPTRQDIEEIGDLINVHFALNAILNQQRQIIYALAGSPRQVMQHGIPLARKVCQTPVQRKYNLLIASPGGHPKDINLYQSQKALSHASLITRDGGTVILVAACPEGSGSASYEQFMAGITSPGQVFEKTIQCGFSVGPHKAIQFARELTRINVIIVSNMSKSLIKNLLLTPANNLEEALQLAFDLSPNISAIGILPKAINTIPIFAQAESRINS